MDFYLDLSEKKIYCSLFFTLCQLFLLFSWDYRFGTLILFTTVLDYSVGMALNFQETHSKRKLLLILSLFGNLSVLGFFKYFHFFTDSFLILFHSLGWEFSAPSLKVVLPVGISFYTFQSLSYSIDVYRKQIPAEKNFFHYALFLLFSLNLSPVRSFPRESFCLLCEICFLGNTFLFEKDFG